MVEESACPLAVGNQNQGERHSATGLRCLLVAGILTLVTSLHAATPNIIVLLADDLGYGELGCRGNAEIPTPHIDAIAANGVRFTDG